MTLADLLNPQPTPTPEWEEWQKKIALGNVFPAEARGYGMSRAGGISQPIAPQDAVWNRDRGMPVFAQLAAMRQEQAQRDALASRQMQALQQQQPDRAMMQQHQQQANAIAQATGGDPNSIHQMLMQGKGGNIQAYLQDRQAGRSGTLHHPEVTAFGELMGVPRPPAETVPSWNPNMPTAAQTYAANATRGWPAQTGGRLPPTTLPPTEWANRGSTVATARRAASQPQRSRFQTTATPDLSNTPFAVQLRKAVANYRPVLGPAPPPRRGRSVVRDEMRRKYLQDLVRRRHERVRELYHPVVQAEYDQPQPLRHPLPSLSGQQYGPRARNQMTPSNRALKGIASNRAFDAAIAAEPYHLPPSLQRQPAPQDLQTVLRIVDAAAQGDPQALMMWMIIMQGRQEPEGKTQGIWEMGR